jgi:hypothetical protein
MIVASMTDGEMVQAGGIGGEVSSSTHLAMVEGSRDEYQCRAFAAGRGVVQSSRVDRVGPQNTLSESFVQPYRHLRR